MSYGDHYEDGCCIVVQDEPVLERQKDKIDETVVSSSE